MVSRQHPNYVININNLYKDFIVDLLEKNSRIIAGDVTVGSSKIKIICADTVSVGLSYDTNFNWHMPI